MSQDLWAEIAQGIGEATGLAFHAEDRRDAGGGCINRASTLRGQDGRRFFIKLNHADRLDMFIAEAAGLREIRASQTLKAPEPVCWGCGYGQAWLVLEALELSGRGDGASLGRGLAAMHGCRSERFGWHIDNTVGATFQPNAWGSDWIAFWRERRLGHQLTLARRNGVAPVVLDKGERLIERLSAFFPAYSPKPALLHGDLWGGNYAYEAGRPVIFDPATYYGDREADLAMTELFGGFPADFYAAYREALPLDAGYGTRRTLYNLYHVLNHFNLFGGGYERQALHMLEALLAEAG